MLRLIPVWLVLAFLLSCQSSKNTSSEKSALAGHWIGSANLDPFPEVLYLKYDTVGLLTCFYREIDLYSPENFQFKGDVVSFSIQAQGFEADFSGKLSGDAIKGTLHVEGRPYACSFMRTRPSSLESVGGLVGYYQDASGKTVEVLPYPHSQELTALSILDFQTGKKRIAFPSPDQAFAAGPRMLTPYPTEISLKVANSDSTGQAQSIAYTDAGNTFQLQRLQDLERYEDFEVESKGARIACTLNMPNGDGPFPLLIVVPGTGEVTRADLYNDYAKLLPFKGVATLFYDKRGCGESTGDLNKATFELQASDVQAVLQTVKKKQGIDANRIGIAGFDQAGFVMPIAASQSSDIKFVLNIAGSALSVAAQEFDACTRRMKADGFDTLSIASALQYEQRMFDYFDKKIDSLTFRRLSQEAGTKIWKDYVTSFDNKKYIARWRLIYRFDPKPYWEKVHLPVLSVYADKDLITPSALHQPLMEQFLKQGGHANSRVMVLKDANHLMMLGERRGDFQFSELIGYEASFLSGTMDWVLKQVGK